MFLAKAANKNKNTYRCTEAIFVGDVGHLDGDAFGSNILVIALNNIYFSTGNSGIFHITIFSSLDAVSGFVVKLVRSIGLHIRIALQNWNWWLDRLLLLEQRLLVVVLLLLELWAGNNNAHEG